MKRIKLQTAMALLLLIANFTFAQTTYTVDNNPGAPADFANLQDAIDAAISGDTLLVQGSSIGYGDITLNKQLVIYGPGFYLDQNPNTQVYKIQASAGFALSQGADASVISGFSVSSLTISQCSNILVSNNRFGTPQYGVGLSITHSNGIMIKNNLIYGQAYIYGSYVSIFLSEVCSNLIFKGNYIKANLRYSDGATSQSVSVINNVLGSYHSGVNANVSYNNIYHSSNVAITNDPNFHHNICSGGSSSNNGNNNNLYDVIMYDSVFIGNTDPRYSDDGMYILKSGSPAQGAGSGGVDCGMFGGGYKLSGIPNIPNIYEFTAPETGYTNDGGIQIHVEVKSNN